MRSAWDRRALRDEALSRMRREGAESWGRPVDAPASSTSTSEPPSEPPTPLVSQGGRSEPARMTPETPDQFLRRAMRGMASPAGRSPLV